MSIDFLLVEFMVVVFEGVLSNVKMGEGKICYGMKVIIEEGN